MFSFPRYPGVECLELQPIWYTWKYRKSLYKNFYEEMYTVIAPLNNFHKVFELKRILNEDYKNIKSNNSHIIEEMLESLVKDNYLRSPYTPETTSSTIRSFNFGRTFTKSYTRKFETVSKESYRRPDNSIYTVHPKDKAFFQR